MLSVHKHLLIDWFIDFFPDSTPSVLLKTDVSSETSSGSHPPPLLISDVDKENIHSRYLVGFHRKPLHHNFNDGDSLKHSKADQSLMDLTGVFTSNDAQVVQHNYVLENVAPNNLTSKTTNHGNCTTFNQSCMDFTGVLPICNEQNCPQQSLNPRKHDNGKACGVIF